MKVGFMDLQPQLTTCPQKKAEECGFCGPSFQLQRKRMRKTAHKILNVRSKKVLKAQVDENLFFQTCETGRRTPGFHRRQESAESVGQQGTRRISREQGDFLHRSKCNKLSKVGLVDLDFNRGTGTKGDSNFSAIPVIPCGAMLQIVKTEMWKTLEEDRRF